VLARQCRHDELAVESRRTNQTNRVNLKIEQAPRRQRKVKEMDEKLTNGTFGGTFKRERLFSMEAESFI
jgi:hypothetical protein